MVPRSIEGVNSSGNAGNGNHMSEKSAFRELTALAGRRAALRMLGSGGSVAHPKDSNRDKSQAVKWNPCEILGELRFLVRMRGLEPPLPCEN
jgi:hypothetical protein